MPQQIIKQPDGKYAIFSTVVDGLVATDCTRQEILDMWDAEYRERTLAGINKVCDALDSGGKPYFQFTMTWDEAVAEDKRNFPERT